MFGRWREGRAVARVAAVCAIAAAAAGCSYFKGDRSLIADADAAFPFGRAAVVTLRPDAAPNGPKAQDTVTLARSGPDYVAVGLPPENSLSVRFAAIEGTIGYFVLQARFGDDIHFAGAHVDLSAQRFSYFKALASDDDEGPGLRKCGTDVCVDDLRAFAALITTAIPVPTTEEFGFDIVETLDEPGTLNDGLLAFRRKDYLTAITILRPLAHFGSITAQGTLGVMYYSGLGVPQDDKAAVAFFRSAAEQGDAQGQNNLGVMYEEGRGVDKDLQEAARWYALSAAQEHVIAKDNLVEITELIARAPAPERSDGPVHSDDEESVVQTDTEAVVDHWIVCDAGGERNRTIGACTAVIESPSTSPGRLAQASRYRAEAYLEAAVTGGAEYYDKAIADLSTVIRLLPTDVNAHSARGRAFMLRAGTTDADRALSDFSHAVRLAPNDPLVYVDRAELYEKTGNIVAAMSDMRMARRLAPAASEESRLRDLDVRIVTARGKAWRACFGGPADVRIKACSDFIVAADQGDERIVLAHLIRGQQYAATGDLDRGSTDYSAAIRLDPNKATAYIGRGDIRARNGEYRAAIEDYGKAIEIQADLAEAFYGRGVAHQEIGELTDALDDLQEAASLFRETDDPRLADALKRIEELDGELHSPRISEVPLPEAVPGDEPESALDAIFSGTGIIVSAGGDILTNDHVINACQTFFVRRDQQAFESADLVTSNRTADLAILRTRRPIPETQIAAVRVDPALRLGEQVAVFGFPLLLKGELSSHGNFVTGNISALAGPGDDVGLLQMTTPVQSGNSGGPLIDTSGNVVGVVRLKSEITEDGEIVQNANFAIKPDVVIRFLTEHEIPSRDPKTSPMELPDIADAARQFTVAIVCK